MALLGLLLMLAAGALTAGVVLSNTDRTSAEVFGLTLSNLSLGGLFLAGAATALVFALGLWALLRGLARSRRRNLERRKVVRDTREQQSSLAAEKARLERELHEERSRRGGSGQVSTERTMVEQEPVREEVQEVRTEAGQTTNDRTRFFRR